MDNLPEHILLEIFSYCDSSELNQLVNVCEHWSHVILTSKETNKKFFTFLPVYTIRFEKPQTFIPNSSPINLVVVANQGCKDSRITDNQLLMSLEAQKSHLQKLIFIASVLRFEELNGFENESIRQIQMILLNLEDSIREIEFKNCSMIFDKVPDNLNWNKLTSLKLTNSFKKILRLFTKAKLEKISINTSGDPFWIQPSEIYTFLTESNLQNLKELYISEDILEMESFEIISRNCSLKRLELDLKFIKRNSASLIELAKMTQWKRISFKNGPCTPEYRKVAASVMTACPCIDELKFNKASYDENDVLVNKIFTLLPHIERLRLPLTYGKLQIGDNISFKNLKILEIEAIKYRLYAQKLILILKMCENLKVLKVFWIGRHARIGSEFFESIFENAENLEELHIGFKTDLFELTNEMLKTIKRHGKNLRKLTTFSENVEEMRAKMRIFNETGVKCFVWDKNYKNVDCLKLPESVRKEVEKASIVASCEWSV